MADRALVVFIRLATIAITTVATRTKGVEASVRAGRQTSSASTIELSSTVETAVGETAGNHQPVELLDLLGLTGIHRRGV
jgi:hypothetical protein